MTNETEELKHEMKNAENLHGHLGPFLVIGVKIARLAKKTLNLDPSKHNELQVTATLPLLTPFSCIIDGIQASTKCTIGNRRLKVENSKRDITVKFELKDFSKSLEIQVIPDAVEMLMSQLAKGASNEELAWKIASMPENQLLTIKNGWNQNLEKITDLEKAKRRLKSENLTLSIVKKSEIIFESRTHGIFGFLEAIEKLGDKLRDASVADKIVGKAIALLCIYAKVKAVYALTMSKEAEHALKECGVYFERDKLVNEILDASGKEMCPFEKIALTIVDPNEAYRKFKALQSLILKR
ncbi:DUF1893 domain-containing protein [Candidatus Bathyarchaeota archaeon]|nr:DUF1893 domain-containing protein [Candidatus Bathyarchaeota archaeon]